MNYIQETVKYKWRSIIAGLVFWVGIMTAPPFAVWLYHSTFSTTAKGFFIVTWAFVIISIFVAFVDWSASRELEEERKRKGY